MIVNTICEHLSDLIAQEKLSNEDLVQIIEHVGGYLNLATIPDYAKANKMSYNGVKKYRTVKKIFDVKFVIDNE